MKEVLVECNIFLLGLVMLVSISLGVEFLVWVVLHEQPSSCTTDLTRT